MYQYANVPMRAFTALRKSVTEFLPEKCHPRESGDRRPQPKSLREPSPPSAKASPNLPRSAVIPAKAGTALPSRKASGSVTALRKSVTEFLPEKCHPRESCDRPPQPKSLREPSPPSAKASPNLPRSAVIPTKAGTTLPNRKASGSFTLTTLITILWIVSSGSLFAQPVPDFPGNKTTWKGFTRYDFQFKGRECRVVFPDKPAEGNPWVWNARFPDWHTDIDSILLTEGFYVTYINTDELIGSPKAVEAWNEYYNYLLSSHKFCSKVALEGVSRGGLYVYNFAKKYPWRISCIYAEAPVCDFKTWPGAFTGGKRSDSDWNLIREMYGFKNDAEALAYRDNPVDNLDALAKAKVPVLHMIGLNDVVVPPELNTFVLVNRYVKLGGIATIIPSTRGMQELEGHHFPIETPRLVADFIKYNTPAFKTEQDPAAFQQYRTGIGNSLEKFRTQKTGRVAFLGGSITWGDGWRNLVCDYLQKIFPDTRFDFINAGIPSMGSTPGAFRLEKDVLTKGQVDLLFVEAAVNDRTNLFSNREQVRAMEGIVRHALASNPGMDIVFMYFADPEKMDDYHKGIIPQEIQNHELVAQHYRIPSINLAKEVTDRIDNGEFSWEEDFRDLHPSPFGHALYFRSIRALIDNIKNAKNVRNAKVSGVIPQSPVDPGCYDNGCLVEPGKAAINKEWRIDPDWKPSDQKGTRDDYTDVPMLIGDIPGKTLSFRFTGKAVGIAVAAGPDAGIIEYRIDRSAWIRKDLFTPWSQSLHLPWFFTLNDTLKPGKHQLEIRLTPDKNPAGTGTACRIRYFYINR